MDNNYPPFVIQGADGGLQGILIDQWRLWERKTGIKVEVYGMDWGQALKRMRAGEFDVIDTAFKTAEREEFLSFSKPYQKIEVPIFFDKEIAGITDAKSLRGFPVGVKTGDADIDLLRANGVETLLQFDSYEAVLQAARDRKVTVFVVDLPPALYYLHKFGMQDGFRHSAPLTIGEFHRGVAKVNTALLNLVEDGFARISPAEYKAIEDKWYGVDNFGQRSLRWLVPVAASSGGLLLVLFVWNRTLRRTVRRRTAELKASEELFQSIYNSVNDAIFIHDVETGAVVDVNERMCAMYRCTHEEALRLSGAQLSSGVAPFGQAEALAWLRKAAAGEPQTFTWHSRRKDGSFFWGEVSMRRARIGSVDRIVVTVRDRTQKQEEEHALRDRLESQQRLEAISNATPGVLFVLRRTSDGAVSFPFVSPRTEEIYGVKCEVLLNDGAAAFRVLHHDDEACLKDSMAEAVRTLKEWSLSFRIIHPRKGVVWVEGHATLEREADGGTLWHGFIYDITDRVNAETKLKKANVVLQIRAACDQALVRADDESTLLHSVCATVVGAGGYRRAWVGFAENDEAQSVRPVAVAGEERGVIEAARFSWSDSERGRGPTGTAIRTGKVVVVHDLSINPLYLPWRDMALKRGLTSALSIPILCDGKIIGALTIYSARLEDFAPDEVFVFTELVANLGVRLETIRAKEQRLRAETELRTSEQELRKSQDQLAATLDALPDLLFEVDRAGRIYDFRAPHTGVLYVPPETFLGRTFDEILPAESTAVIDVALDEAGRNGRHFGGTYSLPMADGLKWYELSISTKAKMNEGEQRFIVMVRDVTTRRQAEEALRESTSQVQHLLGAANCLLWQSRVTRRETGEFDWQLYIPRSSLYRRLFGKDPGAPSVLHWEEVAVPELNAMHAACLQALTSDASSYEQEFHAVVEGRTIWLREQVSINKAPGPVWSLVGVITDITERKAAEAMLRENESRLVGIIDSAMDAIITADENGQIVVFNHAAEEILRCPANEAIGRSVERFIPESTRAIHAEFLRQTETGDDSDQVVRSVGGFGLRAGGEEFPCEASVSHVEVKGHRLYTVILRDVTDRVRAEAERKVLHEQVLRSQRLESVGRLAGGIAHDLNNILAPVVLGAPLLREALHDANALETLDAMESSANRGARIIQQLLTFSRGGGGERVPVQLPLIVHEMVAIIRETFPKDIITRTEVPFDVWRVSGDSTQLHQVLMNLCVNARDAMPSGGLLTLALSNTVMDRAAAEIIPGLQPGPYVLLSVADSGIGISPEMIDNIFDPFFTTKEVGKGTGLGLPTVLGIVQGHGGVIQVNSKLGGGTRFSIYLPADESGAPSGLAIVAEPHRSGHSELILLVDDEAAVRLVTRRLLERFGYRVIEALNGHEGVACYERNRPTIAAVITDLVMPILDGASFILQLRKLDSVLPIIAVSGNLAGVDRALLSQGRVQAVLEKPFEITKLLDELDRALHQSAGPVV